MADVWEKDLAQKSSLTTSDFIRVVGSDNVSYKQRVDNVKSALGIGALASYGSLASFYAEFASMAVFTKYFVTFYDDCATALGLPQGTYKGYVSKTTATLADITVARYGASGTNEEYIGRVTFNSSGAVTATNWTKQPTRAEIDLITATIPSANISSKITVSSAYMRKRNNIAEILLEGTANANISTWEQLITGLPSGWTPFQSNSAFTITIASNIYSGNFNASGVLNTPQAISNGNMIRFRAVYFVQ